jgi:hypothetical protein
MRVSFWVRHLVLGASLSAVTVSGAHATIPISERQALIDLYDSTNGADWARNDNWNGPVGTECTWYGVACDNDQTHVVMIVLSYFDFGKSFNMTGSLPPSLHDLTSLQYFDVSSNALAGSIPSLTGLTELRVFNAQLAGLQGQIPSLTGLTNLEYFSVDMNGLSGPIPSLEGLTHLLAFTAIHNQLTGPLPSMGALTSLQTFQVAHNLLSGNVPHFPSAFADPGRSSLCPNAYARVPDPSWDFATGFSPWYSDCIDTGDLIFAGGFD